MMSMKGEPRSVLITDILMLPPVFLDKLQKIFVVENSDSSPPYTFSFLTSKVTVMLFNYSHYFKKLSLNDTQTETDSSLDRLKKFSNCSEAPYILFLGHKVEDFLPSFIHEIVTRINETKPDKSVLYGISTSWKDVATHLHEISEKLGQLNLEEEELAYQAELEYFIKANRCFIANPNTL